MLVETFSVDRIVDGKHVVLLSLDGDETERTVAVTSIPGVNEGDIVVSEDGEMYRIDAQKTAQTKNGLQSRLENLRRRSQRF